MKKTSAILLTLALASGCASTDTTSNSLNIYQTNLEVLPKQIEKSPAFIMRYRSLFGTDEKSKAWEIANHNYKLIKDGKELPFNSNDTKIFTRDHELTITGEIFSPLRNSDYISGLVTYEDSYWIKDIHKFKKFSVSLYEKSIEPAFSKIAKNYGFTSKCIHNCDNSHANKIFEFKISKSNTNTLNYDYLPETFFASVCMLKQRDVYKLNAPLFDPQYSKKAKFNTYRDGLNVQFSFPEDDFDVTTLKESLENNTRYNRRCLSPKLATDAFKFKFGRDLYRSFSSDFPEYYSTLNLSDSYALYQGEIWMLENINNASIFHGIKTIN